MLCFIVVIFSAVPVYAAENSTFYVVSENTLGSAETKSVQVKWCYRTYNGVRQKCLWSITENKWLTDWMDVS